MMLVSLTALLAMKVRPETARLVLQPLNTAAERFGINSKQRVCGWLGQCAHESRLFTAFKEDMFYRDAERIASIFKSAFKSVEEAIPYVGQPEKLANRVYANQYGNGSEASGDGWRYRGKGAIHLTFKANYEAAEAGTGRPYVAHPELLLQPDDACLSGAWFWSAKGCNELMDAGNFSLTTRTINPGMVGAKEREAYYQAALLGY